MSVINEYNKHIIVVGLMSRFLRMHITCINLKNNNSNFMHVDYWRLVNDELKWNTMYQSRGGKRTKVSESGAYTSSSNADINDDEVHEVCPTGQKAAKRKGKGKKDTYCIIEINERKASALEKLVTIREKKTEDNRMTKYMDYLIMDTSYMTPEQKKDHENLCTYIKTNFLKL
ncbi:uncharacterized protein LOC133795063 [Humulus lupulus]|uniref:uncharacterized protein LOC133795063 n=1 Tax=Humulus lupulus TaxID=3486 RepID=UPI002B40CBAE|nr:uncharacterized protein LOC133795063 [Humulus lupulus]